MLPLGDVVIQDPMSNPILMIERKSLSDLLASIKDGRYKEQSYRLVHASGLPRRQIVYIIEGMMSQVTHAKHIVYSSMTSLAFFKGFTVFRTSCAQETAELLYGIIHKLQIEKSKGCSIPNGDIPMDVSVENTTKYTNVVKEIKKDNVTPDNITEIMLCQIPGISKVISSEVVKICPTIKQLIEHLSEDPSYLENLKYESSNGKFRKISKSAIQNIKQYLLPKEC